MWKKRAFCKFHKRCVFDDAIKRKGRMKADILRGKSGLFSYCILLAENPSDQLDIMNSAFLRSDRYREHPPVVYGVAKTKPGAYRVVASLFAKAAVAGMPGEVRRYLETLDEREGGRLRSRSRLSEPSGSDL